MSPAGILVMFWEPKDFDSPSTCTSTPARWPPDLPQSTSRADVNPGVINDSWPERRSVHVFDLDTDRFIRLRCPSITGAQECAGSQGGEADQGVIESAADDPGSAHLFEKLGVLSR